MSPNNIDESLHNLYEEVEFLNITQNTESSKRPLKNFTHTQKYNQHTFSSNTPGTNIMIRTLKMPPSVDR